MISHIKSVQQLKFVDGYIIGANGETSKLLREQFNSLQTEATSYRFSTPLQIISTVHILTFLTWWSCNSKEIIISKKRKLSTLSFY